MSPLAYTHELIQIIEKNLLTSVFQPIVDLREATLYGYEALTRGPANSPLHNPLQLFDTASKAGLLSKLEFSCRDTACKRFMQYGAEGKLFINVSPVSLLEKGYQNGMTDWILAHYQIPAERIVIELSEQYPMDDYALLNTAFAHFRERGFEVAIDDLGAGYAGLKTWSELRPDYVKIDRHFIEHIDKDPVKREFVRSIQEIALELDCKVVAEGIETVEELALVHALGIRFGQGYYLGRPEGIPAGKAAVCDKLQLIEPSRQHRHQHRLSQTVAELSLSVPAIEPSWSLNRVIDLFHSNKQLRCLPVVDDNRTLGVIERQAILELMTGRYSRELHGQKAVTNFMREGAVIVDYDTPLEEVSRMLTTDNNDLLQQDFIITRADKYFGVGNTSTLLRKITEQQIRNARYSNPLTLLPGNVPIYEHIDELLGKKEDFTVAYCDLNHFKPYNDHYGYSHGDEVLRCVSDILKNAAEEPLDFLGHIGGDDFVIIFRSIDWMQKCEWILKQMEKEIQQFYCEQARLDGGLWGTSRQGDKLFFSMLTLAIGVVHPDPSYCSFHHDIAALAMDAKKQAKLQTGNSIFCSRRRRPSRNLRTELLLEEAL